MTVLHGYLQSIVGHSSNFKKANREVVQAHLGSCVRDAFEKGNEEEKITEIMDLLDKMAK